MRTATHVPCPGARRSRAVGLAPVTLEAKEGLALINGTQPSTARRRARARGAEHASRARPTSPRRCRSTRCAARSIRSSRASTLRGRSPASGTSAANIARCSPAARSTSRTSTAAGCRTPTRCAAPPRCTAPHATRSRFVRTTLDHRGQRRDRQPDGVRRRRATSCRAATSTARRSPSPPTCSRIALAQLATISERRTDRLVESGAQRPAGVPDHRRRAAFGLDDGAGHGGGAGVRDQNALRIPAGVDTIPTSANREDHVSMSMGAALKAERALELARAWSPSRFSARARRSICSRRSRRRRRCSACTRSCDRTCRARRRSPAIARHRSDRADHR